MARLDLGAAPPRLAAGSEWLLTASSVLLEVPSVIVPFGKNYLMNPLHADASRLHVAEVLFVTPSWVIDPITLKRRYFS
ncbi:hypothetical protein LMG28138_05023 [Pararobbsia alpina]|uniref:RES domain-containing protein n=2 Tax=Pararobbsia alpina TaxID=621374 RepID=A0A6S7BJZ3_9BURK|nr:hypothetical protein LMG28138_05023 [Pararobbsia alpina]